MNIRLVPCEVCGTEGRIYRQHVTNPYDEVDHGVCPECLGTCMMAVETQPVGMCERIAPSRGCCSHGYDVDRGVLCPVCDS